MTYWVDQKEQALFSLNFQEKSRIYLDPINVIERSISLAGFHLKIDLNLTFCYKVRAILTNPNIFKPKHEMVAVADRKIEKD